ncbi:MAG TPA: helix-turn-helix transcriptional regulator [Vicinamibacterales bacterium]|nr:helix-turn-helix transcriptional regulator [Vicinamibacterales bacterium]
MDGASPLPALSPRERQIVDAMMAAASNKVIAARLGITEPSVKNRLTALYRKPGVSGRLEPVVRLMGKGT